GGHLVWIGAAATGPTGELPSAPRRRPAQRSRLELRVVLNRLLNPLRQRGAEILGVRVEVLDGTQERPAVEQRVPVSAELERGTVHPQLDERPAVQLPLPVALLRRAVPLSGQPLDHLLRVDRLLLLGDETEGLTDLLRQLGLGLRRDLLGRRPGLLLGGLLLLLQLSAVLHGVVTGTPQFGLRPRGKVVNLPRVRLGLVLLSGRGLLGSGVLHRLRRGRVLASLTGLVGRGGDLDLLVCHELTPCESVMCRPACGL